MSKEKSPTPLSINNNVLKDVIIHLSDGRYSKKEIIEALSYGEKNTSIMFPLFKQFQPKYYIHATALTPEMIASFTLVLDLKLNINE